MSNLMGAINKLSKKAIQDLREALRKSYGEEFESGLLDENIQEIGELLLISLAENLKLKFINPELLTDMNK